MSDIGEQASSPGAMADVDRRTTAGIVVGVDGGPAAAAALRWAARQSRVTGMGIQVIYAWQVAGPHLGTAALLRRAASTDARARATRWVIDALADSDPSLPWTLNLVEDAPGPGLVDRSRSALLLVMGPAITTACAALSPGRSRATSSRTPFPRLSWSGHHLSRVQKQSHHSSTTNPSGAHHEGTRLQRTG